MLVLVDFFHLLVPAVGVGREKYYFPRKSIHSSILGRGCGSHSMAASSFLSSAHKHRVLSIFKEIYIWSGPFCFKCFGDILFNHF